MAPHAARGQRVHFNFAQVPIEEMCDDLLNLMAEQDEDAQRGNAANNAPRPEDDRTARRRKE